ncbi:MAG: dihydropteroate synthase [Planctomycetota bacterium]
MAANGSVSSSHAQLDWRCGSSLLRLGGKPLFMGILNVTPDSFSDGGKFDRLEAAVHRAQLLAAEGADILDVGGESTRPDSLPVSLEEELRRVIPVIEALRDEISIPISVDTTKAEVARQALAAGAKIVNDISGLTFDPGMPGVCAASGAGVIVMHIQGTPQTMQRNPSYGNVVEEVRTILASRLEALHSAGIRPDACVIDPGIGFGKTAQHNLELLAGIPRLRDLGRPVLIGHSRKRFVAKILGRPIDEHSFGTVGISLAVIARGADILRLHEVVPSRDCWLAWQAVQDCQMPSA